MSFPRLLVIDWETTGIPSEIEPTGYGDGPQGIEIGAVVVDTTEWRSVGDFSSRVRFVLNDWSEAAERIHGIGRFEAMSIAIPTPYAVVERFDAFLREFFHPEQPILIAGQNPSFDRWFTNQLFWLGGHRDRFPWRFHARMLDTFSLGYLCWGHTTGNDLYSGVCGVQRGRHSAHQDAVLGATVICKAFQLNSSLIEDSHVPDEEIHSEESPGDEDSSSPAWDRDHHQG